MSKKLPIKGKLIMYKKLTFEPTSTMDRDALVNEVNESRHALEKIRKLIRRDRDFNRRLMKSLKADGRLNSGTYEGAYRADLALQSVKNHLPRRTK